MPYQAGEGISVQPKGNAVGMSAVLELGEPQQLEGFVQKRSLLPEMHHWGISGGLLGWDNLAGIIFLGYK